MVFEIELENGKYTYIFNNGSQVALRYGEEWRDLCGDNLTYAMACRINELEEELSIAVEAIEESGADYDEVTEHLRGEDD